MNENLKDQDVLLVKEQGSNELEVVSMDKNGNAGRIKSENLDNPDFLKIDKSANVLENFFENFLRQAKDPTRFEFFRIPAEKFLEIMEKLQEAFKNPDKTGNKEFINLYRVDPEIFLKNQKQTQSSQQSYTINPDLVNWEKFERYGITREGLEKSGNLNKLLDYQKTDLMPVAIKFDDETLRSDARFSLRKQEDGTFSPNVHLIRHKPELDKPYFGIKFTEEDKKNLLTTGNLGRIVEAEFKQGEKTPVLLSLDKLTNELVAFRQKSVKVPETIKGVQLSEQQKRELSEGKAVYLENMQSRKNTPFNAFVQFNADKRGFEFHFDNTKKQSEKQDTQQGETNSFRFPKKLFGVDLTAEQRDNLKAGQTIYVSGMKDKKGEDFNAFVKFDKEDNKLKFYTKNPDKANEVVPDNAHKTQVAVNSGGKNNEATKDLKEPLKQGQTKPDEKQEEKQQKKKTGRKVS